MPSANVGKNVPATRHAMRMTLQGRCEGIGENDFDLFNSILWTLRNPLASKSLSPTRRDSACRQGVPQNGRRLKRSGRDCTGLVAALLLVAFLSWLSSVFA